MKRGARNLTREHSRAPAGLLPENADQAGCSISGTMVNLLTWPHFVW